MQLAKGFGWRFPGDFPAAPAAVGGFSFEGPQKRGLGVRVWGLGVSGLGFRGFVLRTGQFQPSSPDLTLDGGYNPAKARVVKDCIVLILLFLSSLSFNLGSRIILNYPVKVRVVRIVLF